MYRYVKKWGQVFLVNVGIQKKIASYINNLNFHNLVEIGPGKGAITKHIDVNKNLRLIEIDPRLVGYLKNKFKNYDVINQDFLSSDITVEENSLLFGNLPYSIVPQILFTFLKNSFYSEGVFMIQKECFETISSQPGSNNYSSFSVMIQSFAKIKKILNVSRDNFSPIPSVDSVVIHLVKNGVVMEEKLFDRYAKFVRASFSMPRKTFRNNLKKIFSQEKIDKLFEIYKLNEKVRSESLSCDLYLSFFSEDWLFSE